jgi:Phage portal protein/Bacterial CdiA-CT RNAse A domain
MSPLSAGQMALDTHNVAGSWNKALLDNSARPSGALVYSSDGANMSDTQFDRLKDELESAFQGSMNAGRPILLEGGLDWKPLSMSPKDMDFMEAKGMAAREIALAFGVPPLLLGLPGDNTYANYAEANRAFWRQSVLPLLNRTFGSIAHWLAPSFGADFRLEPDLDRIEALSTERAALWARVDSASFLDRNEKRQAVGYGVSANLEKESVEVDIAIVDMADEAGVDDPETEINKLKARLYDLEQKYPGQPRDHGRFSFGRSATSDPPPSSGSSASKPVSSGNVQVAVAPTQGIGWPSMNDASPQNAILSGDEANVKPQLVQLAGDEQYKVDLQEEEDKRNSHAIRDHVGKSDKELMSEVGEFETPNATLVHISEGSFGSIREAEDYTNMILTANKAEVDRVVREKDTGRTSISERLGFVTGREAYAQSFAGAIIPVMRPTFSVKVVVTYAQNSPRGYRVVTSFPFNKSIDE